MQKYTSALNFGAFAGLTSFALFLTYYWLGYSPSGNISYLSMWVPVVFIFLGIKKARTNQDGFISFGEAFIAGLVVTVGWAVLHGMLVYIYGLAIDPGVVDMIRNDLGQNLAKTKEQLVALMGEDMYKTSLEEIKKMTLSTVAQNEVTTKLIGGPIVSLILALVLKKSKPIFDNA